MKKHLSLLLAFAAINAYAADQRELINFDQGWSFAFGNASDPAKDFGRGTEYFNYYTKANSVHNEGPYSIKFVEDSALWRTVDLPFDFVVDLPYAAEASHSHGYKQVGWKYPETSVGWYRKTFALPESDKGKHIRLKIDGAFRDSEVWVNGFLVGREPSGYAAQDYDITDYLLYGEPYINEKGEQKNLNLVCVRTDATMEEGWFYEGGGIYRHTWLEKSSPVHVATDGVFAYSTLSPAYDNAEITIETEVANDGRQAISAYDLEHALVDADGTVVAQSKASGSALQPRQVGATSSKMTVVNPKLWDLECPNLYTIETSVLVDGEVVDKYSTRIGIREIALDPDNGVFINGKHVKLKGMDMHQDHAGVGAGMPDGLQRYRIERLKSIGANAYRASHNPTTKETLDACDELGMLVFAENRLMGSNPYEIEAMRKMIKRDRNHPCIFTWSVGNEEWGLEWDPRGEEVARTMSDYVHQFDPTRPSAVASSSGPTVLLGTDIAGYNYIMQHPVDEARAKYPQRIAMGSEETSGCGTRGVYFPEDGRMPALNREPDPFDGSLNRIERGWKFYDERPWLGGLFYWTGLDYRGEPNPLSFPATGSQFGIFDYCGFPKDEAYYLKSWWVPSEPTLYILPHWNLEGHEGEEIDVWAYSNCDEVELIANGKNLGRKAMPKNGHLSWTATYKPGYLEARGYKGGKKIATTRINTASEPAKAQYVRSDYGDITVIDIEVLDCKGNFAPTAQSEIEVTVDGDATIIGWGNGDSAFQLIERPIDPRAQKAQVKAFNGRAQVLVKRQNPHFDINVSLISD